MDEEDFAAVTALCWVPRGVAKALPIKYEPTEEQLEELLVNLQIENEELSKIRDEEENETASTEKETKEEKEKNTHKKNKKKKKNKQQGVFSEAEMSVVEKKYNMDNYDDEESSITNLSYIEEEIELPEGTSLDQIEEEDEEDIEDFTIRASDILLLAAITDSDYSHIDVHIYEEEDDNLYVHHEIGLKACVLCMEWLGYGQGNTPNNLLAVGTFDPGIEIWDLDVVDSLEPKYILGGVKKRKIIQGTHRDAVLGLAWNKVKGNVLASCSADKTVKVWNLENGECVQTYRHHRDKVQTVRWHPVEGNVLVSGGFDGQVLVFDVRQPKKVARWKINGDVERIEWNPHASSVFYVTTEEGKWICNTVEKPGTPVWNIQAHNAPLCGLAINEVIPNFVATASFDKTVKLWNTAQGVPNCIGTKDYGLGKLFCANWNGKDSPFLLGIGGEKKLQLWNTLKLESVTQIFGSHLNKK